MDTQKARRFILKIQTLLDLESQQDLSRLEKDLLKSYIQQLYEAITDEKSAQEPVVKANDISFKPEPPKPQVFQVTQPNVETPTVNIPEIKPQPPKEVPVEIHHIQPEMKFTPPVTEYKPEPPPVTEHKPEPPPVTEHKPEPPPVIEYKPEPPPVVEIKKEPVHHVHQQQEKPVGNPEEALTKLFDLQSHDDVADRFSQVPISDIQAAMGLNERIFTLKELFGGDKTLFDATCEQLNHMNSFPEAQRLLVSGPAKIFKWGETERIKMAEQFIRIVARRYPKHGH